MDALSYPGERTQISVSDLLCNLGVHSNNQQGRSSASISEVHNQTTIVKHRQMKQSKATYATNETKEI